MSPVGVLSRPVTVGAHLEVADPGTWLLAPENLAELRALTDARLAVLVRFGSPLRPEGMAALGVALGQPVDAWPDRPGTLPGFGFIADFSAPPREDDGRARTPAWIEDLHFDGVSAYSAQANLAGTPLAANRFVDMAAVYDDLPADLKALVTGRCALLGHLPATTLPMSAAKPFEAERARRVPLVIRHPKSGVAVLRPPRNPQSMLEGLPDNEGRAVIAELWARTGASPHHCDLMLEAGTMVVWEGVRAAHTNPAFARAGGRRSWFYTVPGPWDDFAAY